MYPVFIMSNAVFGATETIRVDQLPEIAQQGCLGLKEFWKKLNVKEIEDSVRHL